MEEVWPSRHMACNAYYKHVDAHWCQQSNF